jgi:hypothetical protein
VEQGLADLTVGVESVRASPGCASSDGSASPMGVAAPTAGLQKAGPDSEWLAPVAHHASGPADPNPKAGLLSR